MGLFDIFRRKKEAVNFGADIAKLINQGLLFEEEQIFLYWNEPITEIVKRIPVKEKIFADRSVFDWGEHTILRGLKLQLTTILWYHKAESEGKRFNLIEFTSEKELADKFFTLINNHMENLLQIPGNKEITETSTYLEWIVGDIRLSLNCYEKYSVKKLKFEIVKL